MKGKNRTLGDAIIDAIIEVLREKEGGERDDGGLRIEKWRPMEPSRIAA